MEIVGLVTVISALFFVISLSEPLAEQLRLPFTVVLAVIGTLLGGVLLYVLQGGAGMPAWVAEAMGFQLRASLFLYVFLPVLLFRKRCAGPVVSA